MTSPGYTLCNSVEDLGRYAVFDACERWNGSPCASCKEHADLDAQLVQLLNRRRELRTKINQCHDPVTAILPTEITSRIFEFSLPDDWFFGRLDGLEIDDDAGAENDDKTLHSGPLLLGAVCRAWRHIAWLTPSLWTAIHICLTNIYRQRPRCQHHVEIVSAWLARSGHLPLFIHLSRHTAEDNQDWGMDDRMGFKAVDEMYRCVIELLNQHSGRWEHLQMANLPENFVKLLGTSSPCAPRLRTLVVDGKYDPKPLFADMPGMKPFAECVTLIQSSVKALNIQWNHATNVSISIDGLEECFTLLQSAPQLAHFKWEITGARSSLESPSILPQPVVHHALQSLKISFLGSFWDRPPDMKVFLNNFTFPHLNDLRMNRMGNHCPWDTLLAHIKRSSCPLTTLALCNMAVEYWSLIAILEETPLLIRLQMPLTPNYYNNPEFRLFRRLSSTSVPDTSINMDSSIAGVFLPKLKIFELTWISDAKDRDQNRNFWNCIPDIFGPISQSDHPKRRPLDTLRISWEMEANYQGSRLTNLACNIIGKEAVLRLLELAEVGVVVDLRLSTLGDDLFNAAMDYYDILPPLAR